MLARLGAETFESVLEWGQGSVLSHALESFHSVAPDKWIKPTVLACMHV